MTRGKLPPDPPFQGSSVVPSVITTVGALSAGMIGKDALRKRPKRGMPTVKRPVGAGASEERSVGAVRSCAVTRVQRPRERLLRFVLDPSGQWTADLVGRLPGRGLYVIPTPTNVRLFLKRRGGGADADLLLESLGRALSRRFLDGIGLARRAGCLRRGLRDVTEVVRGGERPLLLLASDTAVHTRKSLEHLMQRHALKEVWALLDREQFGLACGNNGPVAVLAVMDARMSLRVRADAFRWQDFFDT